MGTVESRMLDYIRRRLEQGALSVTEAEVLDDIVPPDHPEYGDRPAFRYGLERLRRRLVINAIDDSLDHRPSYIGNYPSKELEMTPPKN